VLHAVSISTPLATGLQAIWYPSQGLTSLPKFGGRALGSRVLSSINLPSAEAGFSGSPAQQQSPTVGMAIRGYIQVPVTGVYTFALTSRDGSRLTIDDQRIVDNDGLHPTRLRSGSVWLERGLHRIECDYFCSTPGPVLSLRVRGVGMGDILPTGTMFYHIPTDAPAAFSTAR